MGRFNIKTNTTRIAETSKDRLLIVVDMQNDFVTGVLGTPEARAILPKCVKTIKKYISEGYEILCTKDTHHTDYLNTQEGKKLPVTHCIKNSVGWELVPAIKEVTEKATYDVWIKETFGDLILAGQISCINYKEIVIIGVCTDICVVSNALLLKAACPETEISVIADCCAGVTPEKHKAALAVMESCQITII